MNDKMLCGVALGAMATAGYSVYVCATHGDGIALAAFIGFLGVIGGWLCSGNAKKR